MPWARGSTPDATIVEATDVLWSIASMFGSIAMTRPPNSLWLAKGMPPSHWKSVMPSPSRSYILLPCQRSAVCISCADARENVAR